MWLFTKVGFYSVVQDGDRTGVLVVRSRDKKDLETLVAKQPEIFTEIVHLPGRDYAWRSFVYQAAFAPLLAQLVLEIDYSNFKSKVEQDQGLPRELLYSEVWGVMRQLQDGPRQRYLPPFLEPETRKAQPQPRRKKN
jgi:hypothetical protein